MARIIDYAIVIDALGKEGLTCVYPNGGAFAFADRSQERFLGWITAEDASLRPAARRQARLVDPPTAERLAELMVRLWLDDAIGGEIWLMPKSHWAHELHHGSGQWLREVLQSIEIDPRGLDSRTTADAIAFATDEDEELRRCAATLLGQLRGSDFSAVLRTTPVLCTLHHHQQLWWQTTDERVISILSGLT